MLLVQSHAIAIFGDCTASATQAHIDVFGGALSQPSSILQSIHMVDIVIKHPHLHQTDATEGHRDTSPKYSWKMLIGYNLLQS